MKIKFDVDKEVIYFVRNDASGAYEVELSEDWINHFHDVERQYLKMQMIISERVAEGMDKGSVN